ncbi:MAG: hypothetical protein KDB14_19405 [Planctomycetales bacterium]|nr:hypothetical protein [Planctomycetales bacterium]
MTVHSESRLLCIAADRRFAQLVDRAVSSKSAGNVLHVDRVDAGLDHLRRESFTAVLFDMELAGDSRETDSLCRACADTPLVIATNPSCEHASSASPLGDPLPGSPHTTVVPKAELDEDRLAHEMLRLLANREARLQRVLRAGLEQLLPPTEPENRPPLATCSISATLCTVHHRLPENTRACRITGACESWLRIELPAVSLLRRHCDHAVVIVEQSGRRRAELFRIRERQTTGTRLMELLLQREDLNDLLPAETLRPCLRDGRIALELPQAAIDAWESVGVLISSPLDRVLVCPKCGGVPSLRPGCRSCGSPWVESTTLIHHYACAHVGPAASFGAAESLQCPKCLAQQLAIGADCEQTPGPARCHECGWTDTQRELYGRCFRCTHLFPASEAVEEEVIRYDVDRLDPLDLVAAP